MMKHFTSYSFKSLVLLAMLMVGVGNVWGNTASCDGTSWKNNRVWTGPHASFSLSGSDNGYNLLLDGVDIKADTLYTVSWTANSGCTMKVTSVSVKAGSSKFCSISVSGQDQQYIGWITRTSTASNLNITGATGSVTFSATNIACVYTISVTYTITPSAPSIANKTTSVYVTVDLNDKKTLDVANYFTVSDNDNDFTKAYRVSSGGNIVGSQFYATSAGTYTVTSNITATKSNCHEASATSDTLNITVNRISPILHWDNEGAIETNMMKGGTQNISASASSNQTISYSSNNTGVLSVDATGKLIAKEVGEAIITASVVENGQYTGETITKTFQVKSKDTPIFTPNGFAEGTTKSLKVGDKVTLDVQYVSDGLAGDFKAKDYSSNILGITREGNVITIEALNEGNSSVTFAQTENTAIFGASKTYSFSISKIDNTFAADATHSMKVEDEWANVLSGKNSDGAITASSTDATVAYYDVANNKVVAQNTGNQSFDSKEVTITIQQAATYKYAGITKSIAVTVSKLNNHISINGVADSYVASVYMDTTADITLTATNTDYANSAITATQTAGSDIAVQNDAQTQVTTNHNLGDATWTVSQPENYKYKAASATFTVSVVKQAEATCYVKNLGEQTLQTKLGNSTDKFTWDDANAAGVLSYQVVGSRVAGVGSVGNSVQAFQLVDGEWKKAGASYDDYSNDTYSSNSVVLDPKATGVYFTIAGSYTSTIKDIRITRKTYLTIPSTVSLPISTTSTSKTATFDVDWSMSNGGSIKIVSENPKFTVSPTTISNSGCEGGSETVTITYHSDVQATNETAKIVVYNGTHRKELMASGSTTGKLATTMSYIGAESYNVDQTNLSAGDLFSIKDANNATLDNPVITLASDNDNVITVENNTLVFGHCAGTATITATYAGDDDNLGCTLPQTITVNKIDDHVSFETGRSVLVAGDMLNADWAECTSGSEITYTSSNTDVLKIENGQIIAVAKGDVTLTATSEGTCYYSGASTQMSVKVRLSSDPCGTLLLDKSATLKLDIYTGTTTYTLADGPQDMLTFSVWKCSSVTTSNVKIVIKDAEGNQLFTDTYGVSSLSTSQPATPNISIDLKALTSPAKTIEFSAGGTLYKYVSGVKVSQRAYLTPSTTSLTMSDVALCETAEAEMTIDYSDLSAIQFATEAEGLSYKVFAGETELEDFSNDCGDYGTYTLKLFYTPTEIGNYSKTFKLAASGKEETITFSCKVTAAQRTLVWDIPAGNTIYATQSLDLTAYGKTACEDVAGSVTYEASPADAVSIEGNHITFLHKATVTVTARATASDKYTMLTAAIEKVWTVEKTGVKMTTLPTITSAITYGDTKSVVAWADGWQAVDVLAEEPVTGAINYVGPDAFTAAGAQELTFNFTPSKLNIYDALQFTVPVTVQQATPVATATAAAITYGQKVSESVLTNNGPAEGTWAWAEDVREQVLAAGTYDLQAVFTPADANYKTINTAVTLTVNEAPAENVFIGTDGDWTNPANWQAGVVPSTTMNVNITVKEGSSLTIGTDATLGNMLVEAGGHVDIADEADVQVVNDFRIDSRYTSSASAESGHVSDPSKISVTGNAYMELALDPSGQAQYGWYAFSVPFEVNMATGVFAIRNGVQTQIVNGKDFKVQCYSESRRAAGQYGWVRENSMLHPGTLYMITVDNTVEQNMLVFRAADNTMTTTTDVSVQHSATGTVTNQGWNGIGNTTLGYAKLPDGTKLQVYNFANQCYDTYENTEHALVVGEGAFVQVQSQGSLTLQQTDPASAVTAPRRAARVVDEFRVDLLREDGTPCDRLYLSASEEATGIYTIGRDLAKMKVSTNKAQMWSTAYGMQLCDVELPLSANKALVPLTVSAPAADTYVLSVASAPADATLYLTYNGSVIWNLSMSEYELDLVAGTDSAYGLLIVANNAPAITTGTDDAEQGSGVKKQLINNQLYITLPNGTIFDATGKKMK